MGVAQLAGVSRSFTYENSAANSMIAEAQTRTQARAEGRIEGRTAQAAAPSRCSFATTTSGANAYVLEAVGHTRASMAEWRTG